MDTEVAKTENAEGTSVRQSETGGVAPVTGQPVAQKKRTPFPWPKVELSRRAVVIAVVVLLVAGGAAWLYRNKGLFIAATVNGESISRLSVVRELEKQSGKAALDSLITKRLIADAAKAGKITVTQKELDAEIRKIETQVTGQGGTLDEALAQQGMTKEGLVEQITIRKELEKILADEINVTDDEVNQYITKNKSQPAKGVSQKDFTDQIKQQLSQQKFSQAVDKWITDTKEAAKIDYFVSY